MRVFTSALHCTDKASQGLADSHSHLTRVSPFPHKLNHKESQAELGLLVLALDTAQSSWRLMNLTQTLLLWKRGSGRLTGRDTKCTKLPKHKQNLKLKLNANMSSLMGNLGLSLLGPPY